MSSLKRPDHLPAHFLLPSFRAPASAPEPPMPPKDVQGDFFLNYWRARTQDQPQDQAPPTLDFLIQFYQLREFEQKMRAAANLTHVIEVF